MKPLLNFNIHRNAFYCSQFGAQVLKKMDVEI